MRYGSSNEAAGVSGVDEGSAGIRDGGAAGFGEQPERAAGPERREEIDAFFIQGADRQFLHRNRHAHGGKEPARGLCILDREVAQASDLLERGRGQGLLRHAAEGRGDRVQDQGRLRGPGGRRARAWP